MSQYHSFSATNASRVIGFIDIDAFEVQLWQRDFPKYRGKPCAVVNSSGRILSVSYEAKALGINRRDTPNLVQAEAKGLISKVHFFHKPDVFGKQDSEKTRRGTWEVVDAVKEYCVETNYDIVVELASSDELYLDLTPQVTKEMEERDKDPDLSDQPLYVPRNVVLEQESWSQTGPFDYNRIRDYQQQKHVIYYILKEEERLVYGAILLDRICKHLFAKTELQSSGGVATNKLLSKVGCGINKPGKITICPEPAIQRLSTVIPIKDIPGLGGVMGENLMNTFKISLMSQLAKLSAPLLAVFHPDMGPRIYSWARGRDNQHVIDKCMRSRYTIRKPIRARVKSLDDLKKELNNRTNEMKALLKDDQTRHNRITRQIRIDFGFGNGQDQTILQTDRESGNCTVDIYPPENFENLATSAYKNILAHPEFDPDNFEIVDLTFSTTPFIYFDDVDSFITSRIFSSDMDDSAYSSQDSLDSLDSLDLFLQDLQNDNGSPPPRQLFHSLRVEPMFETQNYPFPTFTNQVHLGSFRITSDLTYSDEKLTFRRTKSLSELEKLRGIFLGSGHRRSDVIKDPNHYYELRHRCFITWLQDNQFLEKVKDGTWEKPDFVTFSGRLADTLRTPAIKEHGDWEVHAVNVDDIIYLWDEKRPQLSLENKAPQDYYDLYFETLASEDPSSKSKYSSETVDENDRIFAVTQVTFGAYKILVVGKVDSVDESGHLTEINLRTILPKPKPSESEEEDDDDDLSIWTRNPNPGVSKFIFENRNDYGKTLPQETSEEEKYLEFRDDLNSWTRNVIPGISKSIVGNRSDHGILTSIVLSDISELSQTLGGYIPKCLEFQFRLMHFIKDHLAISNPNLVKVFSWINGSKNILSRDVHPIVVPSLVLPKLYYGHLETTMGKESDDEHQ